MQKLNVNTMIYTSIGIGLIYWLLCSIVSHYVDGTAYYVFSIAIFSILIGIIITAYSQKTSFVVNMLFCLISLFVGHFISLIRCVVIFYNEDLLMRSKDLIISSLFLILIELFFATIGMLFIKLVVNIRRKEGSGTDRGQP